MSANGKLTSKQARQHIATQPWCGAVISNRESVTPSSGQRLRTVGLPLSLSLPMRMTIGLRRVALAVEFANHGTEDALEDFIGRQLAVGAGVATFP